MTSRPLLAGAVAVLLSTAAAFAADLPARTAPPPVVPVAPVFTWTGFYVGVNAGYGWSASKNATYTGTDNYLALAPGVPGAVGVSNDGFIGGAQAGYNYQIGAFVIGAEADIQYSDLKSTGVVAADLATSSVKRDLNWFGTVRARAGYAVDRLLVYGTGGLIYGETKLDNTITGNGIANGTFWTGSKSDTAVGWTVGAGAEYAITNNFTAKVEYLYYDLGTTRVDALPDGTTAAALPGVAGSLKADNRGNIIRAGLNYKF
jgi:outer membrane immunogenic protein